MAPSMRGQKRTLTVTEHSAFCVLVFYLKQIYNLLFGAGAGVQGTMNFPQGRVCVAYNLQFYFSYVPRKRYIKTTIMVCF